MLQLIKDAPEDALDCRGFTRWTHFDQRWLQWDGVTGRSGRARVHWQGRSCVTHRIKTLHHWDSKRSATLTVHRASTGDREDKKWALLSSWHLSSMSNAIFNHTTPFGFIYLSHSCDTSFTPSKQTTHRCFNIFMKLKQQNKLFSITKLPG